MPHETKTLLQEDTKERLHGVGEVGQGFPTHDGTIPSSSIASPPFTPATASTDTTMATSPSLQRLVLVAAATAATLGYDVGIMAAAIHPLEQTMGLSGIEKEIAMGSLNFVAAAGAIVGGTIANQYGRQTTVQVCSWMFVVGTLVMAGAPSYLLFVLGRMITGMGVGVSFVVAPIYLSEVAPSEIRGKLNTVFDVAINGGILLGYVLGFIVQQWIIVVEVAVEGEADDDDNNLEYDRKRSLQWRLMLGLGIILPILVLLNLRHLPESPRWLVMVGRAEEAYQVMHGLIIHSPSERLHFHAQSQSQPSTSSIEDEDDYRMSSSSLNSAQDSDDHPTVRKAISSIEEELQSERNFSTRNNDGDDGIMRGGVPTSSLTPLESVSQCRYTSGMKLALALGFWQQITGTEAVLYYSADFLQHAGLESPTQRLIGNCFVGLCKLTPELVAMQWVDTIGRRPLMLISALSLMGSTFLLAIAFQLAWHPMVVVILLCTVMASFSIGLGPFSFLVAAESLGLSERATGMTLCAAINRCTSGIVALTAVSLYEAVGSSGLFFIYGMMGVFSFPFYLKKIPETSGQSLEELAAARNREVELHSKPSFVSSTRSSEEFNGFQDENESVFNVASPQHSRNGSRNGTGTNEYIAA